MCSSGSSTMESPGDETGRGGAPLATALPNGSSKIIGRNVNGTSKSHASHSCALRFFNCTQKWTQIYFAARFLLLLFICCLYYFHLTVFLLVALYVDYCVHFCVAHCLQFLCFICLWLRCHILCFWRRLKCRSRLHCYLPNCHCERIIWRCERQ